MYSAAAASPDNNIQTRSTFRFIFLGKQKKNPDNNKVTSIRSPAWTMCAVFYPSDSETFRTSSTGSGPLSSYMLGRSSILFLIDKVAF